MGVWEDLREIAKETPGADEMISQGSGTCGGEMWQGTFKNKNVKYSICY